MPRIERKEDYNITNKSLVKDGWIIVDIDDDYWLISRGHEDYGFHSLEGTFFASLIQDGEDEIKTMIAEKSIGELIAKIELEFGIKEIIKPDQYKIVIEV